METSHETYSFSADINQLLSLIINAVYSNKEVFVRELISNASDALNKIRYLQLTDTTVLDSDSDLNIKISFDKDNKQLIFRDSGIGMTKEELINNLGTIASSGTKKFFESLNNKDVNLIGQFGVGFYSAYLVSDTIDVISKNNNSEQYKWSSKANGVFTIEKDITDYDLKRGTIIVLHLKEEESEFLNETRIIELIKKHNQFIEFPIYVQTQQTREVEVDEPTNEESKPTDEEENKVDDELKLTDDDETKVEDVEDENKPKPKTVTETYYEYDQVNKEKPLWTRNPKEVSEEEYGEFYKSLTNDYDTHLDVAHFNVEGQVEFRGLLYVPKRSPINLYDGQTKRKGMIKLYSRKVFITDDCEDLLPEYLKFIRGVIETEDIPLNISRETLQHNKILKLIGKNIVKKVFEMFVNIGENTENFRIFYEQYNKLLKLGIHEEGSANNQGNKNKLASLLRYESSKSNGDLVSFDEYIENMSTEQKSIYYITAESVKALNDSPFLEKFKAKNYEVLYLIDPLDEYVSQQIKDYKDKKLVCISKENVDLDFNDDEKKEFEQNKTDYKNVCDFIKSVLSDNVEKVVVSNKLDSSPCILSTSEYAMTSNMQRILKAQTFNNGPDIGYMMGRKILEINPSNSIIKKIKNKIENQEIDDELKDIVLLMYEATLQVSGFTLENPASFSNKVLKLIDHSIDRHVSTNTDIVI
jgi:molecular chaperone HtpG